jgi:DNA repair photolyase
MKEFKGKAIYNPSGKAGEYSYFACNFYVGCSNGCVYCYLKKGRGSKTLGGNEPKLKTCFKDEQHALEVFKKELDKNVIELQNHGLFFSFTTDPMLSETIGLTLSALYECQENNIPVKILTKTTDHINHFFHECGKYCFDLSKIAIGFTLTGSNELEPKASSNFNRIDALMKAKEIGYKTFASIEPITSFWNARQVIRDSVEFVDLFKVGLMSGKKYDIVEAQTFVEWLDEIQGPKIYLKESLQKLSKYTNTELDEYFVERDYNLFK